MNYVVKSILGIVVQIALLVGNNGFCQTPFLEVMVTNGESLNFEIVSKTSGEFVATSSGVNVAVIHKSTGRVFNRLSLPFVSALDTCRDFVAVGDKSGVQLLSIKTGAEVARFNFARLINNTKYETEKDYVTALRFSSNCKYIYAVTGAGLAVAIDTQNRTIESESAICNTTNNINRLKERNVSITEFGQTLFLCYGESLYGFDIAKSTRRAFAPAIEISAFDITDSGQTIGYIQTPGQGKYISKTQPQLIIVGVMGVAKFNLQQYTDITGENWNEIYQNTLGFNMPSVNRLLIFGEGSNVRAFIEMRNYSRRKFLVTCYFSISTESSKKCSEMSNLQGKFGSFALLSNGNEVDSNSSNVRKFFAIDQDRPLYFGRINYKNMFAHINQDGNLLVFDPLSNSHGRRVFLSAPDSRRISTIHAVSSQNGILAIIADYDKLFIIDLESMSLKRFNLPERFSTNLNGGNNGSLAIFDGKVYWLTNASTSHIGEILSIDFRSGEFGRVLEFKRDNYQNIEINLGTNGLAAISLHGGGERSSDLTYFYDLKTSRRYCETSNRMWFFDFVAGRIVSSGTKSETTAIVDRGCAQSFLNLGNHAIYIKGAAISFGNSRLYNPKGNQIAIVDTVSGTTLSQIASKKSSKISAVSLSADEKYLFAISDGDSVEVFSLQGLISLGMQYPNSASGQVTVIDEGYFSVTDLSSVDSLSVRWNGKMSSIYVFWDVFHRPDIVQAKLHGDEDYVKRASKELTIEKALRSPPPTISAVSAPKAEVSTPLVRIPYTIKSEGGGVGEVLVLHNGKLIKSDGYYKDAPGSTMVALNTIKATSTDEVAKGMRKMLGAGESNASAASTGGSRDSVVVRQAKPKTLNAAGEYSDSVEIDVIPGEDNEITVMARNQDNTILGQGQTVRFKSSLPKADPHLWILPVGIASFQDSGVRKLASPKKDALDFACSYGGKEALKSAGINCDKPGYASSLFKSANIHVIDPLTNEKATRANILAKLDEIAAKAKPTDTFIWFVSSHGTMDANSVYGIVPFDAKCQDPKCDAASGLVSSNDILEKSKSIKAMKQLLILDTCQAGGLDNKMSGLYDARMSGLAKNMGLHLYAAATATESALDGQDASKNSIFTATLLEGLAGASAKNTEGQISIVPLGQYVKTKTPEASRKAYADMTAQTPVIQHFGKDAPLAGVATR
jgi:hypothetical protein